MKMADKSCWLILPSLRNSIKMTIKIKNLSWAPARIPSPEWFCRAGVLTDVEGWPWIHYWYHIRQHQVFWLILKLIFWFTFLALACPGCVLANALVDFGLLGSFIQKMNKRLRADEYSFVEYTNEYSPGVYILHIKTENETKNVKIVIQ